MEWMFGYCKNLKYLDLSNFDTSNVIDMNLMFSECNKLKEIKGIDKLNLNKTFDMNKIFQSKEKFGYLNEFK